MHVRRVIERNESFPLDLYVLHGSGGGGEGGGGDEEKRSAVTQRGGGHRGRVLAEMDRSLLPELPAF